MTVYSRIAQRHGEITPADVITAWENYVTRAVRVPAEREMRIGFDSCGRELEMTGVLLASGQWLVYHAMTPPSKKTKRKWSKRGGGYCNG